MSIATPDFSEEVTPPKPGTYRARVQAADMREWPGGTPYVNWKLECVGSSGNFSVFHTTNLSGRGVGFFRRFMEAINPGYSGEPVDLPKLVGQTLSVELGPEVRDGQKTGYLKVVEVSADNDNSPFPDTIPF